MIKEQNNKKSDIGLHLCLLMTIYNFVNHLLFSQFRCTGDFLITLYLDGSTFFKKHHNFFSMLLLSESDSNCSWSTNVAKLVTNFFDMPLEKTTTAKSFSCHP